MNNEYYKDKDFKKITLNSINHVRKLLDRFENVLLNGATEQFTDLEKNDLMDIVGLEDYELEEFLNKK